MSECVEESDLLSGKIVLLAEGVVSLVASAWEHHQKITAYVGENIAIS
jgi:hypothetical protein